MFKKSLDVEKEKTKRALSLAMIEKSDPSLIKSVKTASNESAIINVGLIKTVEQEEKGWYYDEPDRNTLIIRFLDGTWTRLEMIVEDFISQAGIK